MAERLVSLAVGIYLVLLKADGLLNARKLRQDPAVLLIGSRGEDTISCFTRSLYDFSCFWDQTHDEGLAPYRFYYQYQNEERREECPLTVVRIRGNVSRYLCTFPTMKVFLFAALDIEVLAQNATTVLRKRDIYVNRVVLLQPPSNVTVTRARKPRQLNVRWTPPQLPHLEETLMYEVNFSSRGSSVQKVEVIKGKTECVIVNLKAQTEYTVSLRVKPDGVSIDGYWSEWSTSVTTATDSDLDPLILSLSLVLILIILVIFITGIVTHQRILKEKMWPSIPSPETRFDGLFTVYKGNFQEWLGRANAEIWWSSRLLEADDCSSSLEVLSEVVALSRPGWGSSSEPDFLLIDLGHEEEEEEKEEGGPASQAKAPLGAQLSGDSQEAYVVLNHACPFSSPPMDSGHRVREVSEDDFPLQTLFEDSESDPRVDGERISSSSSSSSSSHHRLKKSRSAVSSGIEGGSPQSSLEAERGHSRPIRVKPGGGGRGGSYPYLVVSDSGISAGYSSGGFSSLASGGKTALYAYTNLRKGRPQSSTVI